MAYASANVLKLVIVYTDFFLFLNVATTTSNHHSHADSMMPYKFEIH